MVNRRHALAGSREGHGLTRRDVMHGLAAMLPSVVYATKTHAAAKAWAEAQRQILEKGGV